MLNKEQIIKKLKAVESDDPELVDLCEEAAQIIEGDLEKKANEYQNILIICKKCGGYEFEVDFRTDSYSSKTNYKMTLKCMNCGMTEEISDIHFN